MCDGKVERVRSNRTWPFVYMFLHFSFHGGLRIFLGLGLILAGLIEDLLVLLLGLEESVLEEVGIWKGKTMSA